LANDIKYAQQLVKSQIKWFQQFSTQNLLLFYRAGSAATAGATELTRDFKQVYNVYNVNK